MSDGKTHDLAGIGVAIAASMVAGHLLPLGSPKFGPFVMGSVLGFTHLSPDIDLPQSRPSQRWLLLNCFWSPLRSMTKHRGITHTPFVGSAVVMIYAFVLTGLPLSFLIQDFSWAQSEDIGVIAIAFYLGVTVQQLTHLLLDGILFRRIGRLLIEGR